MQVFIRSMKAADVGSCAAMVCESLIGRQYEFDPMRMEEVLLAAVESEDETYVAESGGMLMGFAWVDPQGAFSTAPYLRLIAVDPRVRSAGVGSALLAEFEERTTEVGRDFCLLVSDFNEKAVLFYQRHGYRKTGYLEDFAKKGITEILMVKKREKNHK
jgi:ribosomal protein S18 acetylase RimI-like enzyme